jgi:hypothetical protein
VTGVGERVVAAKRMIFAACHAIHAVAARRGCGMRRFSRHLRSTRAKRSIPAASGEGWQPVRAHFTISTGQGERMPTL